MERLNPAFEEFDNDLLKQIFSQAQNHKLFDEKDIQILRGIVYLGMATLHLYCASHLMASENANLSHEKREELAILLQKVMQDWLANQKGNPNAN